MFLTSKLKNNRTYDHALKDLKTSLKRSGVDYFDLYLMHSAIGGPGVRKDVWRALVDAQKQGLVKSIGVGLDSFLTGKKDVWTEGEDIGVELGSQAYPGTRRCRFTLTDGEPGRPSPVHAPTRDRRDL